MAPNGFRYDAAEHRYYLGDKELIGVTKMLRKLGVYPDFSLIDPYYRERGKAIHRLCDGIARLMMDGEEWDPDATRPQELVPYGKAYVEFLKDTKFIPHLLEEPLYSWRFLIAGTPDQIGECKSVRWLIDLKTGDFDPAYLIQMAIYEILFEDNSNLKIDETVGVELRDDGHYRAKFGCPNDRSVAMSMINTYNWRRENGRL